MSRVVGLGMARWERYVHTRIRSVVLCFCTVISFEISRCVLDQLVYYGIVSGQRFCCAFDPFTVFKILTT
jgi:hypothetical protein